jgi:hypothetical protein
MDQVTVRFIQYTQLIWLLAMILCAFSCLQAQNENSEKEAERMLLEYYTKHLKLWETTQISDSVPSSVLFEKIDSLMQIYCTLNLRAQAKEAFENAGVDVPTNNLVSVYLNENLTVKSLSEKNNEYIVSFSAEYKDDSVGPVRKRVVLIVTLVKENHSYKLDSVK